MVTPDRPDRSDVRSFRFDDPEALLAEVQATRAGRTIAVCLPCRNEEATVGALVASIRSTLQGRTGLVDELIVIDDGSTDATARVAADAGATVVSVDAVHAVAGPGSGKGNALWASLAVSRGDLVVWCDADVTSFRPDWIVKLVAPLLAHDELALVKAAYRRPEDRGGGGRTTELTARPLLSLFHPVLAALDQPLAGEYAVRRSVIEQLPMVQGWGVEVALLVDVLRSHGPAALAQVDLGLREHRHRPLDELAVQAAEVAATILARSPGAALPDGAALVRSGGSTVPLNLAERPPLAGAPVARPEGPTPEVGSSTQRT